LAAAVAVANALVGQVVQVVVVHAIVVVQGRQPILTMRAVSLLTHQWAVQAAQVMLVFMVVAVAVQALRAIQPLPLTQSAVMDA
jgi:hypothetical protein